MSQNQGSGAGGTSGGVPQFFVGLAMMAAGLYLLLQSIMVTQTFSMGYSLYSFHAMGGQGNFTSGMVLIPFCAGVALIFRSSKSLLGWSLAVGSLAALVVGVIASIHFEMRPMSLFELVGILVLGFGGLGIFLRSLRPL